MNLRPAGSAGLYRPAIFVEGYLPRQCLFFFEHEGPRPDEMHIAAKNVVKLRKFVHTQAPNPAADAGEALVHFLRRLNLAVSIGVAVPVHLHGAKLIESKNPSALAHASLPKQDGSS